MAKNFSDKYLNSLKPKDKPYQVRDAKGFAMRILPSGTKTFLFIYETNGKRKQLNLGNYPYTTLAEARKKYNEVSEAWIKGEPLVKEPEPVEEEVLTVKSLIEKYLKSGKGNKEEWEDMKKSTLERHLKDWFIRPASSIKKSEAVEVIEKARENGDGAALLLCKTATAMYTYAIDAGLLESSPFTRIQRAVPAIKAQPRSRFLNEQEIREVWKKIDETKGLEDLKKILKIILLTAQRPGEVFGMHRREINGDWWTIPAERAMKGKRDHRVFLTKTVKDLIGDREGYIFPNSIASGTGHISRPSVNQFAIKVNGETTNKWTPHDLRRTARTHMSRLRIPREHAEAVLNHAKGGMVKVYDQYEYDDEKREALQAWERELLRLVTL